MILLLNTAHMLGSMYIPKQSLSNRDHPVKSPVVVTLSIPSWATGGGPFGAFEYSTSCGGLSSQLERNLVEELGLPHSHW